MDRKSRHHAVALALVAAAGCKAKPLPPPPVEETPVSSTGDPMIDRAIAMRDQVPDGVPRWRDGTAHLATDRTVALAADAGDALVAASGGALLRVPKDGKAATVLADFGPAQIRDLAVTAQHAVATVDGGGTRLVAVPLAGGAPVTLVASVPALAAFAAAGDRLYASLDRHRVDVRREPDLATATEVVALPPATPDAVRDIHGLVVDDTGVGWIEQDFAGKAGDVDITDAIVARVEPGQAAPAAVKIAGAVYASSLRVVDRTWYVLATSATASAAAPGIGTYYEDHETLSTLDPATGALTAVSAPMTNTAGMELAHGAACIAVRGPKLEFGKQSKIALWRAGKRETTELASGLLRASVLAIDATHCYVVEQGKPGIAAIPI